MSFKGLPSTINTFLNSPLLEQRPRTFISSRPEIQECIENANKKGKKGVRFLDFSRTYHEIVSSNILEYGHFCSEQISKSENGEGILKIMEKVLDAQLETKAIPIVLLKFALSYSKSFPLLPGQQFWLQNNSSSIEAMYKAILSLFAVHVKATDFYSKMYSLHYLAARHAFENEAFEELKNAAWSKYFPVITLQLPQESLNEYLEEFKFFSFCEIKSLVSDLPPREEKKEYKKQPCTLKKDLQEPFHPALKKIEAPVERVFQAMQIQESPELTPHKSELFQNQNSVLKDHIIKWLFQETCNETGFEVVGSKKLKSEKKRLFSHAGKHFIYEAEVPKFLSLEEPTLETMSVNTRNESLQSFLSDETTMLCTAFIIEDGISSETYLDALLKRPHTVNQKEGEETIKLASPIPALAFEKVGNDRVTVYKMETSTLRNYFDDQRMHTVYPIKED